MPAFRVCGGRRTGAAGADELDGHDAGHFVDVVQDDVAAVGLQGRTDDFDGFFDLFTHGTFIQSAIPVRSMPCSPGPAILAHQGGWDEMLLVAGPIVLIAGLLTSPTARRAGGGGRSGRGRERNSAPFSRRIGAAGHHQP